jgi:hypothetical protein
MLQWPNRLLKAALATALFISLAGCLDDDESVILWDAQLVVPEVTMANSLHGTTRGMEYWYSADQNGFEQFTGVPYENLACGGCHTTCQSCHDGTPGAAPVSDEKCKVCHSRQGSEIALGYPDVHRDAGMGCTDCHSLLEVHGDGNPYNSMFDAGARNVNCQTCHGAVSSSVEEHQVHLDNIACQSCHMESSVTCVNCHFKSEIEDREKIAFGKFHGWQFLGNWEGKVYPFNFQSVEYEDNTLVAYGPYTGHTVTREGRVCGDCHGSTWAREYLREGSIKLVEWDAEQNKLVGIKGLIPIPPDFASAFQHDFATRVGDGWQFLEEGPDVSVMVYGQPLTLEQIRKLSGGF